jgi:para-nitrobenzyl esterase
VIDATARGAACPQFPSRLEFVVGSLLDDLSQDEDCLTLAVVAPLPDGTARPVMVFFHGGADDRVEARHRGVAARVPIMIGTTADDALPFLELNPRTAPMLDVAVVGPMVRRLLSAYFTGRLFSRPAAAFAKRHRRGGGHALTYRFDWRPSDGPLGACHCIELPFLMGSSADWASAPMLGSGHEQTLAELGPPMRQLWYEFARGMFDQADTDVRLPGTLRRH